MIDIKTIDEMTRKLASMRPTTLLQMQDDMRKNLRAALEGIFQELDLVTREEYNVQVALLARNRERLKALEARVEQLEQASGLTQSISTND
jgi:ubiquinone biosynthesis accessory factor UbiK